MEDFEVWKEIKGFEGLYMIGNKGTLLSNKKGCWRIMSVTNKNGWYLTVILTGKDGKRKTKRIHQLVYEAFTGEVPKGYHIHHKDGNMQNNK